MLSRCYHRPKRLRCAQPFRLISGPPSSLFALRALQAQKKNEKKREKRAAQRALELATVGEGFAPASASASGGLSAYPASTPAAGHSGASSLRSASPSMALGAQQASPWGDEPPRSLHLHPEPPAMPGPAPWHSISMPLEENLHRCLAARKAFGLVSELRKLGFPFGVCAAAVRRHGASLDEAASALLEDRIPPAAAAAASDPDWRSLHDVDVPLAEEAEQLREVELFGFSRAEVAAAVLRADGSPAVAVLHLFDRERSAPASAPASASASAQQGPAAGKDWGAAAGARWNSDAMAAATEAGVRAAPGRGSQGRGGGGWDNGGGGVEPSDPRRLAPAQNGQAGDTRDGHSGNALWPSELIGRAKESGGLQQPRTPSPAAQALAGQRDDGRGYPGYLGAGASLASSGAGHQHGHGQSNGALNPP